jgi:hypothetical protein
MAIGVVVRDESGADISGFLAFQTLVSAAQRERYPMLSHIDPLGNTIFNRAQVRSLLQEVESIAALVAEKGIDVVSADLGMTAVLESLRIPGFDLKRDLLTLLAELEKMCQMTLERRHRYLWFVGD